MSLLKNKSGMTLVETMVAAGIVGAVALTIPTITQMATKSSQTAQVNISWQLKRMQVEDSIQTIDGCENSLVNDPDGGPPYTFGNSISRIRSKTAGGGSVLLTNGTSYPSTNSEYTINDIELVDKSGGTYGPNTLAEIKITVQWEKDMLGKSRGSTTEYKIPIEVAVVDGSSPITGCRGRDATFTATDACVGLFGGNLVDISGSGDYRCLNIQGYQGTTTPLVENTILGRNALAALAVSSEATAVGDGALQTLTNGTGNTAVGYLAMNTSDGSMSNTAVGAESMNAHQGSDNTALGFATLTGGDSNSTGNVAIGSNTLKSNSAGSYNTAAGYYSLYNSTSGIDNVAIGSQTLYSNTTSVSNVAVGSRALYLNITDNNVAVGTESMFFNTTGYYNTAVGHQTLYSSSTSSDNAAVGFRSMYNHSDGWENTALGSSSLFTDTSGRNNTAIGAFALSMYNNPNQGWNTALGAEAMMNTTTGISNTSLGDLSLRDNTTGEYNVVVGASAKRYNTTGNQNIAIGERANAMATTSSYNVAIGSMAMYGSGSTTGEANIAMGYWAMYQGASANNNIAIGHGANYQATPTWNNIMIGSYAGQYNSGDSNIGIGTEALGWGSLTSVWNLAVGRYAGASMTSGHRNVLLGGVAGRNLTSGAYNVFIGVDTAYTITSGSRNIVIGGYQGNVIDGFSASTSMSDRLIIGQPSDTTGNFTIMADMSRPATLIKGYAAPGSSAPYNNYYTIPLYALTVGTDSGSDSLWAMGQVKIGQYISGGATPCSSVYPSDYLEVCGSINISGTYKNTSDARLKTNIKDISPVREKVLALKPKSYNMKTSTTPEGVALYDTETSYGFLAQEVKPLFPGVVFENDDGYLSLNYNGIFTMLVKAFQEEHEAQQKNLAMLKLMSDGIANDVAKLKEENKQLREKDQKMQNEINDLKKQVSEIAELKREIAEIKKILKK